MSILLAPLSVGILLVLFLGFMVGARLPNTKDPVAAYKSGTLIDCSDRYPVFIPEPTDVAVLLDTEDKRAVFDEQSPFGTVYPERNPNQQDILFLHRLPNAGIDAPHLYTFVFLFRDADGGYCAEFSRHGQYAWNADLLQKYKQK